jgi:transcriptional regulator with XRE-family HTH domain
MKQRVNRKEKKTAPFAKILTSFMDEKGVGVREAARIAGVGASTVVSWRSGALPQEYAAVKRLAEHFGTTLGFLLTGEHDSKPANTQPAITEVFEDAGMIFDGYAKITVQRLLPKNKKEGS